MSSNPYRPSRFPTRRMPSGVFSLKGGARAARPEKLDFDSGFCLEEILEQRRFAAEFNASARRAAEERRAKHNLSKNQPIKKKLPGYKRKWAGDLF